MLRDDISRPLLTGVVKLFSTRDGYGFIVPDNGGLKVYAPVDQIVSKHKFLCNEDRVEYSTGTIRKEGRLMAMEVTSAGGQPIDASFTARRMWVASVPIRMTAGLAYLSMETLSCQVR